MFLSKQGLKLFTMTFLKGEYYFHSKIVTPVYLWKETWKQLLWYQGEDKSKFMWSFNLETVFSDSDIFHMPKLQIFYFK